MFAERAAVSPSSAAGLEPATLQAMARLHARDAVLRIATEGLRWGIGAGQTDPAFASALHLEPALAAQAGLVEDMDGVARDLARAYPAK
jgi:hypothetical protein